MYKFNNRFLTFTLVALLVGGGSALAERSGGHEGGMHMKVRADSSQGCAFCVGQVQECFNAIDTVPNTTNAKLIKPLTPDHKGYRFVSNGVGLGYYKTDVNNWVTGQFQPFHDNTQKYINKIGDCKAKLSQCSSSCKN